MQCVNCNHEDTKVIDSRPSPDGHSIRRRRKCEECGTRFTTYEKIFFNLPAVVKGDRRRETYSREKILKGLKKACEKRPVKTDQLDTLLSEIERELVLNHPKEISSKVIGEMVMSKLRALDPVSFVRFASFYWSFSDIDSFVTNLRKEEQIESFTH